MVIYNYQYKDYTASIKCTEIEVTETPKQYRAKRSRYTTVYPKKDAGKLIKSSFSDSAHIFMTERNDEEVKRLVIEQLQRKIKVLEDTIKDKKENIKKLENSNIEFDIVEH